MANIRIDQLANVLTSAVQAYTQDVGEAIENKVDEVADAVLQDTKRDSPYRTGRYRKGFAKTKRVLPGQGYKGYYIWNKKYYRLVHLQEFGHAKRGGGRVAGKPHLRPAYDRNAEKLQDDIKRIIRNGGGG
ncbi:hypothetical protein EV294_101309 [Paenibacillus sp. BK033]|uniref:HK97 gp10 family phage protein n=1 Tax=Paenibacillus sp. BK033 TaxID=2512133 RepID=UPI00104697A9|nr:HK97 gp10 family phage protein [Paenibacillus sp. BK033]TCN00859.1 hypothetical protein EV294_101309 [Paenibacillus sp. BK033]